MKSFCENKQNLVHFCDNDDIQFKYHQTYLNLKFFEEIKISYFYRFPQRSNELW